ncbi:MAG: hypothetical protein ABSG98_01255 [Anaerolineales bacterium]|jgi:Ca2+-binding RTX toxin-like protein
MLGSRMIKLTLLGGAALLLLAVITAFAASNSVPKTLLTRQSFAINANSLKPSGCASLNLSVIVTGSGTITHNGSSNALILGSAGNDTITGGSGDDCILGGGGHNTINGRQGTNVCYGNKTDTFTNCQTIIYY